MLRSHLTMWNIAKQVHQHCLLYIRHSAGRCEVCVTNSVADENIKIKYTLFKIAVVDFIAL